MLPGVHGPTGSTAFVRHRRKQPVPSTRDRKQIMATYSHSIGGQTWRFDSLRELLAKASPLRSGDCLAGVAAASHAERAAAQMTLAEVPLKQFLSEAVIAYESDEVTRLIIDRHDAAAFAPVGHLSVGGLGDWLRGDQDCEAALLSLVLVLTPERAGAGTRYMRMQEMILLAKKNRVLPLLRNTMGPRQPMPSLLQPNHP